ncbi:MAG: reverse transcriptase domain-containing protein [Methylotenera sp.]
MVFTQEIIKQAYLYVKNYAYHDNLNLFLKKRIAEFEIYDIGTALVELCDVLNHDSLNSDANIKKWLSQISYHILPKSIEKIESEEKDNGLYLTNVKSADKYNLSKINYLVSAPVEIHILETLWALVVGPALESTLTKDCYGNRLNEKSNNFLELFNDPTFQQSSEIFKRYIDQYNTWRNLAIDEATNASKQKEDVAILSLDLKSYFYQINIVFSEIESEIDHYFDNKQNKNLANKLNRLLEQIFDAYHDQIDLKLSISHPDCIEKKGIPIGFVSSSILANWYLKDFDHAIVNDIRPIYYGRYVDDILLVFKQPEIDEHSPIDSFIKKYLPDLLLEDNKNYELVSGGRNLPVQKDKLILHFFDKNHSVAGLEIFKQELDERSSAFKLLPTEHIDSNLDQFAYDILYDGSPNKLRSIVGLAENETELARFLSSHITAHRLCKLDKKDTVLPQLKLFFKGKNALQFFRLWEKVYQYALIIQNNNFSIEFHKSIKFEINKLSFKTTTNKKSLSTAIQSKKITQKIKSDLELYNNLSLSLCLGLLAVKAYIKPSIDNTLDTHIDQLAINKPNKLEQFAIDNFLSDFAKNFRISNLIRHHLVAWPLANYTNYHGNLTNEENFRFSGQTELKEEKVKLSPRFLHFDEWQLYLINSTLQKDKNLDSWLEECLGKYKSYKNWANLPITLTESDASKNNLLVKEIKIGEQYESAKIKVAVANIKLLLEDIEAAVRKDKKPNISFERQTNLFDILNTSLKNNVDILVLPEVAIPVSWLPFMTAYARRHQIGLIFGLEHWVIGDIAYNLIIEALPFRVSGKYKSCVMTARIKNHYSPAEIDMLESVRLKPANLLLSKHSYHKIQWRNTCLTSYNCFELSDINHRSIFKSEIDLLIACVWNKDTNYYGHILESVVRDIHCYVVQSNTSQYGGSCVLRPSKTEYKTMLYVKGGDNASILTAELDIKALRNFQFKSKKSDKDQFKHLPPGYDNEAVLKR